MINPDHTRERDEAVTDVTDILGIGIGNPLGKGLVCNVQETAPAVLDLWKAKALEMVYRPEMELGYIRNPGVSDEAHRQAFAQFQEELSKRIEQHPIEMCELTIYAIGTVFVCLDLASDIPVELLQGVYKCYEFAAYNEEASGELHVVARAYHAAEERGEGLRTLSKRPAPKIQQDEHGYRESRLFTSFSCIGLSVDPTDNIEAILERLQAIEGGVLQTLTFDYHGRLHFGWAACLLEPRTREQSPQNAMKEMARMQLCIQIAHIFLGTCEAFERLFLHETVHQINGYVTRANQGRTSEELNRLRTLVLAVVSLTSYGLVTATDEDQTYFRHWEKHAHIKSRHRLIQDQCALLYNVQVDETRGEEERRERRLNRVVLVLTAFTFISVMTDAYNFVDYKEGWIGFWLHRMQVLIALSLPFLTVGRFILLQSLWRSVRRGGVSRFLRRMVKHLGIRA